MKTIAFIFLLVISSLAHGQGVDTLAFFSDAFNETRTVYVHTPPNYKYKSKAVKFPVIYLLDGQHQWFVNPILSDIKALQTTHEIPSAIVVVIPHKNRNKECNISDLDTELPLDAFITQELDREIQKYDPSELKLLVGHSFSASFSLYSYYNHPAYYTAVIAHTPIDEMELLIKSFLEKPEIERSALSISIGGIAGDKDHYHREKYDELKEKYPDFYDSIKVFEADYTKHNAVPIVSSPMLLTRAFEGFSSRYLNLPQVDLEFHLVNEPETAAREVEKVMQASKIGTCFYPPEISDINGIASRYWNNDYEDIALELYKLGIEYYPRYYEFYFSLYELTLLQDKEKAREYLEKGESLLKTIEDDWEGKGEILEEIEREKEQYGW